VGWRERNGKYSSRCPCMCLYWLEWVSGEVKEKSWGRGREWKWVGRNTLVLI
jgi:hypothetical protein